MSSFSRLPEMNNQEDCHSYNCSQASWENIDIRDEVDSPSRNGSCCQDDESEPKQHIIDIGKQSVKEIIKLTPDFVGNIVLLVLVSLLGCLICLKNKNGENDVDHVINLSLIWISAMIGGYSIRLFRLPSLLGMIIASVILTNCFGDIVIPESWGEIITSSSLAIILLRSGLELDLKGVKQSSGVALRLTCIPGTVEAIVTGILSMIIFGMPFWLGLSLGFILAAVSPALVVVGMLDLQQLGFGVKKGIPSLVIAAASFDDIVAITGFSFFISLAVQSENSNFVYTALHGPLSIIIGITIGSVGGLTLSLTHIWNTFWKRTAVSILSVLCIMFGMKTLSFAGAGAMGSLITGIVASHCWKNGIPTIFSKDACEEFTHCTESHISTMWSLVFEPLLFGYIGSALDFEQLLGGSLTKCVGIIIVGVSFRLIAAYVVTAGGESPLTTRERLFISLVWMPKATVQAALCSFPLILIKNVMHPGQEEYDQYIIWANQIVSTAILSIIITAPLGLIFIQFLGPKLLTQDKEVETEKETNIQMVEMNETDVELLGHIKRLDNLVQKLSLSSSPVEKTLAIAEIRQVIWKSKSALGVDCKRLVSTSVNK